MLTAVRLIHIAVAAAWFGHKLLIPADLRQAVGAGGAEAGALVVRLDRAEWLGVLTGLGTLVTGVALVFVVGPDVVGSGVYVGLGLVVAAIVLGAMVARPATIRLRRAVAVGDMATASVDGRTVSRVLATESVLWSAALVSMLV